MVSHHLCPPDAGLLWMIGLVGFGFGLLVGNLTKRCPPYEDDPPD